jgi:hypothetical protein
MTMKENGARKDIGVDLDKMKSTKQAFGELTALFETKGEQPMLLRVHSTGCFFCNEFVKTWDNIKGMIEARPCYLPTISIETKHLDRSTLSDITPAKSAGQTKAKRLLENLAAQVHGVPFIALLHADGTIEKFNGQRNESTVLDFIVNRLTARKAACQRK